MLIYTITVVAFLTNVPGSDTNFQIPTYKLIENVEKFETSLECQHKAQEYNRTNRGLVMIDATTKKPIGYIAGAWCFVHSPVKLSQ